ncbi:MAG: hypothetical protein H0U74_16430 [Bradymonadaceae bacterium]|nr:hypothetical protein [Lujinxingiaceae bacterium]
MMDGMGRGKFAVVGLLVMVLLTSCSAENERKTKNTNVEDTGVEDTGSTGDVETDGESDDGGTAPFSDWKYIPYPSEVASSDCSSLESASFSRDEVSPLQALTVGFDCVIDVASLTVTVGDAGINVLQITPTVVGFMIPAGLLAGPYTVTISSTLGSVTHDVDVMAAAPLPGDPKAYLLEFLGYQRALAAQMNDPHIQERLAILFADSEANILALSAEEAEQVAAVLLANESYFGLEQNTLCQGQTTPESWWDCFSVRVAVHVVGLLVSAALVYSGVAAMFVPLTQLVGVATAAMGIITLKINLHLMHDDMWTMLRQIFQLIAPPSVSINSTSVDSGIPFSLSAVGEYVTFSGTSRGPDATSVTEFLKVIAQAHDVLRQVNEYFDTGIELYRGNEPPQTRTIEIDPQYLSVSFAPGRHPDITGTFSGMTVTLTSTADEPVPVTLLMRYHFAGVRTIETSFEVMMNCRSIEDVCGSQQCGHHDGGCGYDCGGCPDGQVCQMGTCI